MVVPLEATAAFRVANPEGSTREQIAADAPLLRDLAERLPDLLIYSPSTAAYEKVRPFYNADLVNRPGAIVRPRTDAEVAAIVREARAKGIPFGIRSGGHDMVAAQLQGKDGVIIDLRALDSAVVAEDRRSARVGGGIIGVNLSKFLHEHGLLTPHGWCADVGIAGWALGGGYGYSSAFYGLGVDQVLGARVVLAGGEIVDTDEHPDLLWALRGAGNGNFGVVVELRIKVYPETGYLGGLLGYPNAEVGQVLTRFGELEKDLPVNFSGELAHMTLPGVGPVLVWVFAWTSEDDSLEQGWAFHPKLKALGTPILDTVTAVTDYGFFSAFYNPTGNRIHARVCTIDRISPGVSSVVADSPPPGPLCATIIHSAHGRALQENPEACYPLRKRHRVVNPCACVPDNADHAADFESYKKWNDGMIAELSEKGLTQPYGYRNLGPEQDVKWANFFGEETLARLKRVKQKFDPENVFKTGFLRLELI